VAMIQRSNAVSQSRLAQSEEMAAEAINLLPADGPLAMLLGVRSDLADALLASAT